jgi:hypothetical protein
MIFRDIVTFYIFNVATQTAAKVGGQCVRLVSQSSDYFPLTAVDGFQILVPPLTLPILLITSNSHNLMWDPTV